MPTRLPSSSEETETPEARQGRLDADRAAQQFRRDRETPEARQGRLDADRAAQQLRRDRQTPEARQARLQQDVTSTCTCRASGKRISYHMVVYEGII